jgi:AraC-like DNA-binding protein
MDRNTIFVYYFTMALYYNPNVRLLLMRRLTLSEWHYDNLKSVFWRLYWNSAPGAAIRYQKQTIALTPDRIILVSPNTPISPRLFRPPMTHFHVHFLTDAPFNRLYSKIYIFKAEADMVSSINALPAEEKDLLTGNLNLAMAVRGWIHCLLARIPAKELEPLRVTERLVENMDYIEDHIQSSLANRKIARQLNLSVNAMLRLYRRELGMSPQAYLRLKRIEKACALLHDPQMNIKQIAEETGFCDRYHFSRMFKALQGTTPSQYRRRFR